MAIKKFAFLSDEKVFTIWTFDTGDVEGNTEIAQRVIFGLENNPSIIPVPEDSQAGVGWIYDGTNFISQAGV